jgi:hypothetical protein
LATGCGENERQRKREPMLDYCSQDTLGMVKILEAIKRNAE